MERCQFISRLPDMGTLESRQERETKTYHRQLRHLLTDEVQDSFKEERLELTPRMVELVRQLENEH